MAENSLRYSLQAKKEVLGTTDASFDMKLTLEDDSELLESHATPSQQQPKKHCKDREIESSTLCQSDVQASSSASTSHDDKRNEVYSVIPVNTATAVSFSIEVENTCIRQPPKRLLTKTRQQKKTTLEALKDKQTQADERRKQQREQKLQRIHDRQEAARKLAQNVDILLQQRAFAMGVADNNVKPLPSQQIMATANQVAQNFRDLTKQLGNDLSVGDRKETEKSKATCTKNEVKIAGSEKRQSTSQSVSFTVDVPSRDVQTKSTKPVLSAKKKKVLTVEDIEEKQRRAEERRNARKERRIKGIRENREALMKMAKDIERFENLQQAMDSSPARIQQSKESALLAEKIAASFDRLSMRYNQDLKRAENFTMPQPYIVGP